MKKLLIPVLVVLPFINFGQSMHYMLVGTYTSPKSQGIYVYSFNSETGEFKQVSMAPASNPSFLTVSPDKQFVYAINEDANDKGSISAFRFDAANGTLLPINKQSSGGDHPCYVAIDQTGKWVTAGNYSAGSLSILPVNPDGSLSAATQTIRHEGKSVNEKRQDKPHVHATVFSPDNRFLFVPDLGIDKVMIYSFDPGSGKLAAAQPPFAAITPGGGPRHFTFHPNKKYAYLMEELSGNVAVYQYEKGKLTPIQTISAVPSGFTGYIGSADIHVSPDGHFLYCSNRGESNTIAIFSIDKKGRLTLAGHHSAMGKAPRNFNFDPSGNFLLVANQDTDNIVIFKRDTKTGLLTETGKQIEVGKPVCVKWIE